jgi:hypothetical protein
MISIPSSSCKTATEMPTTEKEASSKMRPKKYVFLRDMHDNKWPSEECEGMFYFDLRGLKEAYEQNH